MLGYPIQLPTSVKISATHVALFIGAILGLYTNFLAIALAVPLAAKLPFRTLAELLELLNSKACFLTSYVGKQPQIELDHEFLFEFQSCRMKYILVPTAMLDTAMFPTNPNRNKWSPQILKTYERNEPKIFNTTDNSPMNDLVEGLSDNKCWIGKAVEMSDMCSIT